MLAVLSPAKKLDFAPLSEPTHAALTPTVPALAKDTAALLQTTRQLKVADLQRLMKLSPSLAKLNFDRFQVMTPPGKQRADAKPAALAFMGDTYQGLRAWEFDPDDFVFAQSHLRILSGLYGVLRPLDAIQPYRLEMGTRLATERGKTLYEFWGDKLAAVLSKEAKGNGSDVVVNLASSEYFTAVKPASLKPRVLTCVFKEVHGTTAKVVGFSAKRARGMMARYIVKHRLRDPDALKGFNDAGYRYDRRASSDDSWVFARKHK